MHEELMWREAPTAAEAERLHLATLHILEKVGIVFNSAEACDIFKRHGARVEGKKVFLPPALVEAQIALAPSCFTIKARNPSRTVTVGGGEPVCASAAGPVYVIDREGKRRSGTAADLIDLLKLVQTSSFLQMNGGAPVTPGDLPEEARFPFVFAATALYTDRPLPGFSYGARVAGECLEMAHLLFGDCGEAVMVATINSTTPLIYDEREIEGILAYARAGQPLCVASCAMAGSTAPVTLAGVLILTNAEILAGIVLAQLVNPGTPVIYGNTSSITDMRHLSFAGGAPEYALLLAAAAKMARRYSLPFRGGGSLTDAKLVDAQAGFESMLNLLTTFRCGTDYVLHAAGILDSFLSVSREKFILDEEIGQMIKRLASGITINDETMAVELLAEKGPGGQFLTAPHTAAYCRKEIWQPLIADRLQYARWKSEGRNEIIARAEKGWRERLEKYIVPDIEPGVKRRLLQYIEKRYGKMPGLEQIC